MIWFRKYQAYRKLKKIFKCIERQDLIGAFIAAGMGDSDLFDEVTMDEGVDILVVRISDLIRVMGGEIRELES